MSLSAACHRGNESLTKKVSLLLAVDWTLQRDSLLLVLPAGRSLLFTALPDSRTPRTSGSPGLRSRGWVVSDPSLRAVSSELVSCVAAEEGEGCLLLFSFPVTVNEAQQITAAHESATWKHVRRGRWETVCQSLGGPTDTHFGSPLLAERVYEHEAYYLAAIARVHFEPLWCLVSRRDWTVESLSPPIPFEAGLPPRSSLCRPGPDSRLPRALSEMKDAPEKLELNHMMRPQETITGASGRVSMETGLPFTVGNMAKEGPSSILRMPIFGPPFGHRPSVSEPLAGNENSVACMTSVTPSEGAVLDNAGRRARFGEKNKKQKSAYWNKKATLKVDQCQVHALGHVEGPMTVDFICKQPVSGRLCMGEISKETLMCLECRRSYATDDGRHLDSRRMLNRKRLLEPMESLILAKRLRGFTYQSSKRALLRGSETWSLAQTLKREQDGAAVETTLPADCHLSMDRAAVCEFSATAIYVLSCNSSLVPHGPDGKILKDLPLLSAYTQRREFSVK